MDIINKYDGSNLEGVHASTVGGQPISGALPKLILGASAAKNFGPFRTQSVEFSRAEHWADFWVQQTTWTPGSTKAYYNTTSLFWGGYKHVAGAWNGTNSVLISSHAQFDENTNAWSAKTLDGVPTYGGGTFGSPSSSEIWFKCGGGSDVAGATLYSSHQSYSRTTNAWTAKTAYGVAHQLGKGSNPSLTYGFMQTGVGASFATAYSSIFRYDENTNAWTAWANRGVASWGGWSFAANDNRMFWGSGLTANTPTYTQLWQAWTEPANAWVSKVTGVNQMAYPASFGLANFGYLFYTAGGGTTTYNIFNPQVDAFQTLNTPPFTAYSTTGSNDAFVSGSNVTVDAHYKYRAFQWVEVPKALFATLNAPLAVMVATTSDTATSDRIPLPLQITSNEWANTYNTFSNVLWQLKSGDTLGSAYPANAGAGYNFRVRVGLPYMLDNHYWLQRNPMNRSVTDSVSAAYNGRVLSIGGTDFATAWYSSMMLYNSDLDQWSDTGVYPLSVTGNTGSVQTDHTLTVVAGLQTATGSSVVSFASSTYSYFGYTGSWSLGTAYPQTMWGAAVINSRIVANISIVVIGGHTTVDISGVYGYAMTSNSWISLGNFPGTTTGNNAWNGDRSTYVAAGVFNAAVASSVYRWATGTIGIPAWFACTPYPVASYRWAYSEQPGALTGGVLTGVTSSTTYLYAESVDSWVLRNNVGFNMTASVHTRAEKRSRSSRNPLELSGTVLAGIYTTAPISSTYMYQSSSPNGTLGVSISVV